MTAVLSAAKAGWRGQRRAWLSLAIVAALGTGAVMTAALGARRTDTADAGQPTPVTIRVVGVEAAPGEFPPHLSVNSSAFIRVTPATIESVAGATTPLAETLVRLRRGTADLPAFQAGLRALAGPKPQLNTIRRDQAANVQRSFHLQAVALWLVAALLAIVTAAIVTQLLARQSAIDTVDYATLHTLGAPTAEPSPAGAP